MNPFPADRGTGRTLALVRALKPGTLVVVHNAAMRSYAMQMIHDVRPDLHRAIEVTIVASVEDVDRLRGRRRAAVSFDHAWSEHVPADVYHRAMECLR